jgi:hypothetical protein
VRINTDFQPAATWQHQVQHHQIEDFRVGPEEALFTGGCHDDVVVLAFQGRRQHLSQLPLVLDDQHAHNPMLSSY